MSTIEYHADGRVAHIRLNRPDKLNAINQPLRNELAEAFARARDDEEVWVIVLSANGKHFCSGRDLVERVEQGDDLPGPSNADLYTLMGGIYKPIIAAVHGVALAAGAGLVLASDIRIASAEARFGWPQVKRGVASVSGPTMLSRFVPRNIAFQYMFTGEMMPASEAQRWGILNDVVAEGGALEAASGFAEGLLANAPIAMRSMKEATLRTAHLRADDAFWTADFVLEQVDASEDSREGLLAFKEKRDPVWKGR